MTPLLALAVLRTRAGRGAWLGVVLATLGLALLAGVHRGSLLGDLLVLAGAAVYSLQIVLMERYAPRYDADRVHARRDADCVRRPARDRARAARPAVPARLDGLGCAARHRRLRERARVPRPDVGAAANDGARTAVAFSLEPVWAAFFGFTLAGDRLGTTAWLGCAVIMAGIVAAETIRSTAVLLALGSAALFGGMTVALRLALPGLPDASGATLATVVVALAVAVAASLVRHDFHGAWPFLLTGLLAPGGSQALFTLAVREIGASRTSVAVGAAPLVAVAIALVFLDEPLRLAARRRRARDRRGRGPARGRARPAGSPAGARPALRRGRRDALRDARQPRPGAARRCLAADRRGGDAARRRGRGGALDAARADPASS